MKPVPKNSDLGKLTACFDKIGIPYRIRHTPDRVIWFALKEDENPDEPIDEVKNIVVEFDENGKYLPHEKGVHEKT